MLTRTEVVVRGAAARKTIAARRSHTLPIGICSQRRRRTKRYKRCDMEKPRLQNSPRLIRYLEKGGDVFVLRASEAAVCSENSADHPAAWHIQYDLRIGDDFAKA